MSYLAVSIAADNPEGVRRQINKAASAGAELLELRLDYLKHLTAGILTNLVSQAKRTGLPIIVTIRHKNEGGVNEYPDSFRFEMLAAALRGGADFIDCEYESFTSSPERVKIESALSENRGAGLILSAHDFKGRFPDINSLYRDIQDAYPAAIPKLVYTANHINDCFDAIDLLHEKDTDTIVLAMGEAGLITRVLAKKLGGFVSFAGVDEEFSTAPGQPGIRQFKELYRYDGINSDTEVYGVIGSPIGHSMSPVIHNAAFRNAGLNQVYLPLLLEGGMAEFRLFMDSIIQREMLSFRGFSVTIPHKQNALNYVKQKEGRIEALAERIGAVNTVIVDDGGKLNACNTDYAGALDAITSSLNISKGELKDMPVAVSGAGGVARAVVAGLSDAGANIRIYNRTLSKAEKLAEEFNSGFAGLEELKNLDARLLINCTSIGMYPDVDATPVPKEYLKRDMAVFDTVYNPPETLLLKNAKEAGCKTIDGLSMFVAQAGAQYKLFTGREPDLKFMRKIVRKLVQNP